MVDLSTVSPPVETPEPPRRPTLSLAGITKHFEGVAALTDVSLDVRPGEVHALLGENGAGKSTLMNVASGTVQPDGGAIVFEGQTVALTPAAAVRLGIAIVHQHPAVLPDLTVLENLRVALPDAVFARGAPEAIAERLLAGVGLRADLRDRVERLTVAQKQLLEIAKAFAIEPASGRTAPEATFISVDLPAPFSPRIAWTSPARIATETSDSAGTPA